MKLYENKTEFYLKKFREVHGDRYGYPNIHIKNQKCKIEIVCKQHGTFTQRVDSHLKSSCKKCFYDSLRSNNYIAEFKEVHGDKYDYSLVEYTNNGSKICIICHTHGVYDMTPIVHKNGSGCPRCTELKKLDDLEEKLNK